MIDMAEEEVCRKRRDIIAFAFSTVRAFRCRSFQL
jgi:hypothetical protein